MCWPQIVAAKAAASTGVAISTAAAVSPVAATALTALGTTVTEVATAKLITALSTASFTTNMVGSFLNFAVSAKQASAQGEAATKAFHAEQMQLAERERQEKLKFQIENDQLARNAAMGIAKTKTMATGQGLGVADDRVMDFMMKSEEMAGMERANMKMTQAALSEAADQSFLRAKAAVDQARSATGLMALAGLALDIGSGYFDSYRMFGALPFEDPADYSKRITGIA